MVGGLEHFFPSYMGYFFPLTFIFFKMVIAPPTRYYTRVSSCIHTSLSHNKSDSQMFPVKKNGWLPCL